MDRTRTSRHRVLSGVLLTVVLWLLAPGVAFAHAHLVQADPAPRSVVTQAPTVATFIFDEPVNPTLTQVRIVDAGGRQVTTGGGHLGARAITGDDSLSPRFMRDRDDQTWLVPLAPLPAGTYTVFWTAESASDGHVLSSFYTFSVAAGGGAGGLGAVTGAPSGVEGSGRADLSTLDGGGLTIVFLSWLGLLAQALWLGALTIELVVLAPARRAGGAPAAHLARVAAPRLWRLMRGALMVIVASLAAEIVSLAVQGAGGDWGRALAPNTLGGILSSQNGHYLLLRFAVLLVALLLAAPPLPLPKVVAPRLSLTLLSAGYMLLVALSGHAASVQPGWLSFPIDWLHLVCTAAWVGGIAALDYGVLPPRRALPEKERAPAVLRLLDRYSPVAYVSMTLLALSGLYSAVNHVESPANVTGTLYGTFLLMKLSLVGVLMVLSAAHVMRLRPAIAFMPRGTRHAARDVLSRREGLAALGGLLRLETGVGAAILLATALLGQTLPANVTS